ncbi:hypothetical protein FGO68_gene6754 [Halteria grandinella]|uniref:Uncharacterized protein n=1 Tax=Halteria grandinella TaxID=5974 RepID=A0A8J8NU32_HALGN|nr:hypothetical protein FGO68_gene6754 [Halteria grandinella]
MINSIQDPEDFLSTSPKNCNPFRLSDCKSEDDLAFQYKVNQGNQNQIILNDGGASPRACDQVMADVDLSPKSSTLFPQIYEPSSQVERLQPSPSGYPPLPFSDSGATDSFGEFPQNQIFGKSAKIKEDAAYQASCASKIFSPSQINYQIIAEKPINPTFSQNLESTKSTPTKRDVKRDRKFDTIFNCERVNGQKGAIGQISTQSTGQVMNLAGTPNYYPRLCAVPNIQILHDWQINRTTNTGEQITNYQRQIMPYQIKTPQLKSDQQRTITQNPQTSLIKRGQGTKPIGKDLITEEFKENYVMWKRSIFRNFKALVKKSKDNSRKGGLHKLTVDGKTFVQHINLKMEVGKFNEIVQDCKMVCSTGSQKYKKKLFKKHPPTGRVATVINVCYKYRKQAMEAFFSDFDLLVVWEIALPFLKQMQYNSNEFKEHNQNQFDPQYKKSNAQSQLYYNDALSQLEEASKRIKREVALKNKVPRDLYDHLKD